MLLTKTEIVDKIEIIENGIVQVRTATKILENGSAISETYHRHCVVPGQDYSEEKDRVQAICAVIHTKEVIDAYKLSQQQIIEEKPNAI